MTQSATFKGDFNTGRQPHNLVLIFNRELDLFPVLHHGISYAGLLESVYQMTPTGNKIIKREGVTFDVDLADEMWV